MGEKKMVTLLVDESLLAKVDAKAKAANDDKSRGRTEWILDALTQKLEGIRTPSDKRLAGIVSAYDGMNAKGRRFLATCAALAADNEEFRA